MLLTKIVQIDTNTNIDTGLSIELLNPTLGIDGGIALEYDSFLLNLIQEAAKKDTVEGILEIFKSIFSRIYDTPFVTTSVIKLNPSKMTGMPMYRLLDRDITPAFDNHSTEILGPSYYSILHTLTTNPKKVIISPTKNHLSRISKHSNLNIDDLYSLLQEFQKAYTKKYQANIESLAQKSNTKLILEITNLDQFRILKQFPIPILKALLEKAQGNLRIFFSIISKQANSDQEIIEPMMFVLSSSRPLNRIPNTSQLQKLIGVVIGLKDGINKQHKILDATRKLTSEYRSSARLSIDLLLRAIKEKDNETANHDKRMAKMCLRLEAKSSAIMFRGISINVQDIEDLQKLTDEQKFMAYANHDIGKVGIPDRILQYQGKLNTYDQAIMREHPNIARRIFDGQLKENPDIADKPDQLNTIIASRLVSTQHHERVDGNGYPNQLKNQSIHIMARIASIADAYDALRSKRPYKDSFPINKAIKLMRNGQRTQFDKVLLDLFINNIEEFEAIREEFPDSQEEVLAKHKDTAETIAGLLFQKKSFYNLVKQDLILLGNMTDTELKQWFINKTQITYDDLQIKMLRGEISQIQNNQ